MNKNKRQKRVTRHARVRAKIKGSSGIPRVAIFRSNRYITGQIIDDTTKKTLLFVTTKMKDKKDSNKEVHKKDLCQLAGEDLAKRAKENGITKIVFDRGGYRYHGRVKAFADGLRKGGLIF